MTHNTTARIAIRRLDLNIGVPPKNVDYKNKNCSSKKLLQSSFYKK